MAAQRLKLLAAVTVAGGLLSLVLVGLLFRYADRRELDLVSAWAAAGGPRVSFSIDPNSLERGPYLDAVYLGNVAHSGLGELSGIAGSLRRDDVLWALNDGDGGARLFALGSDGRQRGSVRVEGASGTDWEDLASFELNGVPYLLIADVGDNFSWRRTVMLHVVEEPAFEGERLDEAAEVSVAWSTRFRYEDGPRDCEAVAVDPLGGRVLLLSKREVPAALYELPLRPQDGAAARPPVLVAQRLTEVVNIPQPTPLDLEEDPERGHYRSYPTSMDIAPDGSAAVVLTLKRAYRFARGADESWAEAFARRPQTVPIPPMWQAEALAFARDGRTLYISSEQRPTPIFRLDLSAVDPMKQAPE